MSHIVAGRFDNPLQADAALAELARGGFRSGEYESFYVAPPGQHAAYPIGGDSHSDAGARTAGAGAMKGALIGLFPGIAVGLIASWYLGQESVALMILLGALIGAFAGAMLSLRDPRRSEHTAEHPVEMRAGRMVAVNVDRPEMESRALDILRRHGALDIGHTEGTWRDGSWRDFDPRHPLHA